MAINPEVIPPSSSKGNKAVSFIPRWAIFLIIGLTALILIAFLKTLLPVLAMSLLLAFIWKQAKSTQNMGK